MESVGLPNIYHLGPHHNTIKLTHDISLPFPVPVYVHCASQLHMPTINMSELPEKYARIYKNFRAQNQTLVLLFRVCSPVQAGGQSSQFKLFSCQEASLFQCLLFVLCQ